MPDVPSFSSNRLATAGVAGVVLLVLVAVLLKQFLAHTGGAFVYTLDDPYIHLALASNIAQGHYGINAGEYTSPSSSILWPVLLAPLASSSWGQYLPLVINVLCTMMTLYLVAGLLEQHVAPRLAPACRLPINIALLLVFMLGTNAVGLIFTGLEHSAHVLTVVMVLTGLCQLIERDRVPPSLIVGIVLCPLLRYEGLAMAGVGIAALLLARRWRLAMLTAACVLVPVGGFSLFLVNLGLPPLPNSVLAKSIAQDQGGFGLVSGVNLHKKGPVILMLTGALLAACALRFVRDRRGGYAVLFILPLLGHLLVGRWGWLDRYEMYAMAWAFLTLLFWLPKLAAEAETRWSRVAVIVVLLFTAARVWSWSFKLARALVVLPLASADVHDQHFLMSDIVREYQGAVALNDIGAVAYGSGEYVLDLWGLASNSALRHRLANSHSGWMDEDARQRGVKLAMVYDEWFKQLPPNWDKVGELRLTRAATAAGGDCVSVYVLDGSVREHILQVLRHQQQLHPEAVLLLTDSQRQASGISY